MTNRMDRRALIAGLIAAGAPASAFAQSRQSADGDDGRDRNMGADQVDAQQLPPVGQAPAAQSAPAWQPAQTSGPAYPTSPSPEQPAAPRYAAQDDRDDRDDRDPPRRRDDRNDGDRYSRDEIIRAGSDFLGVTAEAIGGAIERISRDYGAHPDAYIAGTEASASFVGGVRYGKGMLYKKRRPPVQVFWQGPSIGFDWGGNAARSFTLCYGLRDPEQLFQRFPGVEGSAYVVGGLGVNYQRADDITLAPIRAGVGLRLGANVGYLAYTRTRHILPF